MNEKGEKRLAIPWLHRKPIKPRESDGAWLTEATGASRFRRKGCAERLPRPVGTWADKNAGLYGSSTSAWTREQEKEKKKERETSGTASSSAAHYFIFRRDYYTNLYIEWNRKTRSYRVSPKYLSNSILSLSKLDFFLQTFTNMLWILFWLEYQNICRPLW